MKIHSNGIDTLKPGQAVGTAGADRPGAAGKTDDAAGATAAVPTASVHLDGRSRMQSLRDRMGTGDVVDHAKVERVTKALAEGKFKVDSAVVADRLVQGAVDLLGKHK